MGTIDYVAPEQISGKGVDGRTDQYALACVLYQCLTGQVPFPRDEETAALFAHLQDAPPRTTARRPELPPGIDDAIGRAMSKLKEDRFDSCTDFARAARGALNLAGSTMARHPAASMTETVSAPPPGATTAPDRASGSELPSAPSIQAPDPRSARRDGSSTGARSRQGPEQTDVDRRCRGRRDPRGRDLRVHPARRRAGRRRRRRRRRYREPVRERAVVR